MAFDRPADGIETADAPAALSQRSYTMNAITGMLGGAVLCALAAVALSLAGVLALHKTVLAQEGNGSQTPTPESDGLFYEVDGDPPPSIGVDALNSRLVGIDFGQLSEVTKSLVSTRDPVTRTSPIPQTLVLNLFDDVEFIGIVEHVEPTSSGHALWGGLEGVELGTMTLVVNGSVVVGTVRTPGAVYSIRTAGGGAYVVRQIDESSLPPLGEPLRRQFPEPDALLAPPQGREPAESAAPDGPSTPAPTPTPVSTLPAVPSVRVLGETLAGGLFSEVEGDPPPSGDVETLASRLVGIDFGQLAQVTAPPIDSKNSATGSPPTAQLLVLNLFDDVVFTGIVEHIERASSGHALRGRLEGVDWGTFTLVVSGGIVVGTVRTPEGVYEIRTVGVGTYVIRQIDESSLPPLGEPLEGPLSTPETRSESDDVPPDDGYMIDVMVVYTPLAKRREGGRAAIEALIDLFVVETNQAYANSRVTHRIRLVLREEVNYTEDGISRIDLNRLKNDSDGYMDDVHDLRDLYAADLVHIVVGRGNVCGRANLNRGESPAEGEAYGFGLTVDYCGGLVFAHELGHNMGLAHDRYVGANPGRRSNFGYVNQRMFDEGAPESARWRTIMAYFRQCREVGGFYCHRIAYFSNPEVTHNGDPTGVPVDNPSTDVDGPAHAVKTLNERREITANFRRSSTSPTPRVHLTLSPYWLSENGGMSTVTATLHKPSSSDTTVTVTASPSDAVTLSANRVLTIPAGQAVSRGAVTITGVDNGVQTGDVTVIVSAMAENPSSMGVVEPEPVALAVADDETTPVVTLSLSPAEIVEIDGMTFVTAMLDNRSVADTAVTVSATPAEVVEEIEENILTIPAGQSASIGEGVKINAVDDSELTKAEKLVTVSGTAANSQGVTGPESVTLTINDDEAPFFPYDSIAYTFTEGLAGSRFLPEAAYGKGPLTYSLSPAPSNGVTFTPGPPVRMGTSATSAAGPETSYTLTVTDADGVKDTMTISITVRKGVCSNSAAVSEYTNPGIVDDCEALLVSRDVLGGGKSLNWSEDISIGEWEGVLIVHGRVANLQIPEEGLTGTIPSELGSLSSLQNLWLSGTQLTGEIPAELGNLSNLQLLTLSGNQLTGEIPAELGNLSNLQSLELRSNQLTGEIPAELGNLSNLQSLELRSNQLTGEIPAELGNLSNLQSLELRSNQLTGEIPAELGNLSNLQSLELRSNQLTGEIPAELGNLSNLQSLELRSNQLTGEIPAELGNLSNLQLLTLSDNQLTGEIPTELGKLTTLEQVNLSGNRLTGCVPDELRDVPRNDFARLGLPFCSEHPCVTGGLVDVTDLGLMADCGTLLAARDSLAGTATLNWSADIPIADWNGVVVGGTPGRATELRLSGLGLTGQIPPELGDLPDLQLLDLRDNQLAGGIPTELGDLVNLQELYLDGNRLTGCVPDGLRDVPRNDLESLGLSFCSEHPCVNGGAVSDTTSLGLMSDCETLLAARDTLAGAASLNWAADNLVTLWDGVTVAGTPRRVTALFLHQKGLTGEIPAELGSLTNLQSLELRSNQMTGEIPAELGNLSNLHLLSLWDNQLTGEIPAELGNLSNLQNLWLIGNQLTGEIPAELGNLSNLQNLWLIGNQLTGEIPAELGSLTNLQSLSLWDNQLTGEIPADLGDLANLQRLSLSQNRLTGPIPTELGSLANLHLLSLWDNQLTGEIPAELGSLTNLQSLELRSNQLTGEIPADLGDLANLQRLSLSQNRLTGPIPTELGRLANLQQLSLWGNQLTGEIPAELGSLTNLQSLSLWDNQLTGEIPADLGNLSNLQNLWLIGNQLTGEIPADLGDLANLQRLSLSQNRLTGPIPTELGRLANLQQLSLWGNQLTGEIPAELGSLTNLQSLSLWDNQLTGPVPASLGGLVNLEWLYLDENQLTGPIPTELGSLANLQWLSLWGNQLTGPVPAWLGGLVNLEWLYLDENQLTGPIPAELGRLSKLQRLSLSQNQLTGPIPTELGRLSNLQWLLLGGNQLSGPVPAWTGDLANLQQLSLWGNQFTGQIPMELSSLANLVALYLSQNQLSGCIPGGLRDVTDNDLEDLDLPFCDVLLSGLTISPGSTTPPFNPYHTDYAVVVGQSQVTVTATTDHNSTSHFLDENRVKVADADGSLDGYQVDLGLGVTTISISVISQDGRATLTYTIQVSRAARPVAPVISVITPGRGSLSVSWTAPRETGGTNITSYDLRHIESRAPDKADANWFLVNDAWTGGLLSYTITGLTGSTQYDVQVRAVNAVGDGPWSNQASATVPANELPVFTEGVKATRLVAENSAEATNIGMPIAASDADDDTLTYTLGGSDAALFAIDSGTGQIRVGDSTTLDYETKTSYSVDVSAADPYGATAMIAVTIMVTNIDEEGTVTLSTMEPQVGVELTATLDDPDGTVSGATWQWARSSDGSTWIDITEATDTAYTPVAADEGNYLRATASYTDGEDSGKSAQGISDNLVTAGDPLLNRYDANKNGLIDRDEVLQAVVDYFNNIITRDEVLGVVVLYFSS